MVWNKKGASAAVGVTVFIFIAVIVLAAVVFFLSTDFSFTEAFTGLNKETVPLFEHRGFQWMGYVVGEVPVFLLDKGIGDVSARIIVFGVFLLILLTFSDIFVTFGTFHNGVAIAVGAILTVIAVNIKGVVVLLAFFTSVFTGIFVLSGVAAVFMGLFAAFVAFFATNWGIRELGPWLMQRKMFRAASRAAIESEAGGKALAGTIKGLKEVGEALGEKRRSTGI